jgi:hypothetical protein
MALVQKGLVRPDRAILPGEDAFRFRHLLIRGTAHEAPATADRGRSCTSASQMARGARHRLVELDETADHHVEQALRYWCELGPADEKARRLSADAAARHGLAGRRAMDRGATSAAVNLMERAESLLPPRELYRRALSASSRNPAGRTMRSHPQHGPPMSALP